MYTDTISLRIRLRQLCGQRPIEKMKCTKHIYELAARSPTTRQDAKLSFDDGKFFHLSTMGKHVLFPRRLVTSIVAMSQSPSFTAIEEYFESRH